MTETLSLISDGSNKKLFLRALTPTAKRSSPARMSTILPCKLNSAMSCSISVSAFIFDWMDSIQLAEGHSPPNVGNPVLQVCCITGAEHEARQARGGFVGPSSATTRATDSVAASR